LPNYGLEMKEVSNYRIYIHKTYGGAITIYDKEECIYRDGGILIEDDKGLFWGSKNLTQKTKQTIKSDDVIELNNVMYHSIHKDLSPLKILIVRFLNLTALKIKFFADLFRYFIVSLLITGKPQNKSPLHKRTIKIKSDKIIIKDKVISTVVLKNAWRAINLNLFHMASSRYSNNYNLKSSLFSSLENSKYEVNAVKQINLD